MGLEKLTAVFIFLYKPLFSLALPIDGFIILNYRFPNEKLLEFFFIHVLIDTSIFVIQDFSKFTLVNEPTLMLETCRS